MNFTRFWMLLLCLGITSHPMADSEERGKQLFQERCAMCHSSRGFGTRTLRKLVGNEKALLEDRNDLQAEYVRKVIRMGFRNMPQLTQVDVSNEDLDAIAAYLSKN